jgi:hypothetical protein
MWGGLDEALGVRVQPNAPSSTPPTRDEAATASGTQPAPKRAPFNLFDFFGGLDAALGVLVLQRRCYTSRRRRRKPYGRCSSPVALWITRNPRWWF